MVVAIEHMVIVHVVPVFMALNVTKNAHRSLSVKTVGTHVNALKKTQKGVVQRYTFLEIASHKIFV